MRRDAREIAFQYIFASLFTSQELDKFTSSLKEADVTFATQIVEKYEENKDALKEKITKCLVGYEYTRVYKADLAIMYEALTEIEFLQTPPQVAINEALEIAKKYSTQKSAKFINGVLATIVKGE